MNYLEIIGTFTSSGITNFFNELHIEKAKVSISVTLLGIVTFVKVVHNAKALEVIFC